MRYEDYRVEDQVFTNKEDWTDEEKREFLDTCPESKDTNEKVKELRKFIEDVENGVIKQKKWDDINKRSGEAYVKKNCKYLQMISYRYGTGKYLGLYIDGKAREVRGSWEAERVIKDLDALDKRFETVRSIYLDKEARWKKDNERDLYEKENEERIIANMIAKQWLYAIRMEIPTEVKEDTPYYKSTPEYRTESKRFNGSDYTYTNKYGELEFYGQIVTKEDAEYISKVIERATWDLLPVMNKTKAAIEDLKEKYKKIAEEKKGE